MTNLDDDSCDPRVAALMAVHLVSQVLDEAYVIANAAKESGEPWMYISSLKKLRTSRLDDTFGDNLTFTVSKGDYKYIDDNNIDIEVVTSTPQKSSDNFAKTKNDASFIGQGDEDFEATNNILRTSTSMFINNSLDMSDVENFICNESGECTNKSICQNNTEDDEILMEDIAKIIDSYVNTAIITVFGQEPVLEELKSNDLDSHGDTVNSSYSYLDDAFCTDVARNESFYIDEVACNETKENEDTNLTQNEAKINSNDIALYENAYLTLNRDYEASDEDEPVLRDPKTMVMQEVDLLTANTSTDIVSSKQDKKALAATSGVSQFSRKSNLVRRCRIQGSKLLSCLRGLWWRRRLGKRKECRGPGSIHGLCPLSPDARRRAASLLDQRNLRTPSPSRAVFWKFNTVTEALVHSSRWKDYDLKMSLNENDEF